MSRKSKEKQSRNNSNHQNGEDEKRSQAMVQPRSNAPAMSRGGESGWGLRDEFERLFDRMFGGWRPARWEGGRNDWRWNMDVQERDNEIVVRAEAPGFEPNDFDVQVRGENLVLHASHKTERREAEGNYQEWSQQEYYRSIPLPGPTDPNKVAARYQNGVLTITLPKAEDKNARRIPVSS
jgi:HSP20 family protein